MKSRSLAQILASSQSRGPVSEAGNRPSRMDGLWHGLATKSVLIPGESDAQNWATLPCGDAHQPMAALKNQQDITGVPQRANEPRPENTTPESGDRAA